MSFDWKDMLSVVAAVVSAIGGLFAAGAALRSADSAKKAQDSAESAQKKATRLKVFETATQIVVEAHRIQERAGYLKGSYRSMMIATGSSQHSTVEFLMRSVEAKAKEAEELMGYASKFSGSSSEFFVPTEEELEEAERRLSSSLITVRALLQDIDLEQARTEGDRANLRLLQRR